MIRLSCVMCAWTSIVDQTQAKNLRKIQDAWLQLVCWYHPVSHSQGSVLDVNVWGFGAGEDHEEQDALKKTTLPKEGDIAEIYRLKKAAGF